MQERYYIDRDNYLEAIASLDPFNNREKTISLSRYLQLISKGASTGSGAKLDYNVDSSTWK